MDRSLIGSISILHKTGNFCAICASVQRGFLVRIAEACTWFALLSQRESPLSI